MPGSLTLSLSATACRSTRHDAWPSDLEIVCPGITVVLLTDWDYAGFDDLREPEVLLAHIASLTQTPLAKIAKAAQVKEVARRRA